VKISKQLIRQVVLYGIIGGGSAFVDFLLFTLMYSHFGINEYVANVFSVHVGIAISFVLNRKYNFKTTDKVFKRAMTFYATGLFGLGLSQLILMTGNALDLPVIWVKLASIFIVAAIQFVINKFITFKK
jgi:putative flippase GtrA